MNREYFLSELPIVVGEFLNNLKPSDGAIVVGLSGDLGSGKTTFVKELAKQIDIESEITSPTFIVMQNYSINKDGFGFNTLVHIDLYRFEENEEIKVLKLDEVLKDKDNLVLIEWVDKFPEIKSNIKINLKHKSEDKREIEIKYE